MDRSTRWILSIFLVALATGTFVYGKRLPNTYFTASTMAITASEGAPQPLILSRAFWLQLGQKIGWIGEQSSANQIESVVHRLQSVISFQPLAFENKSQLVGRGSDPAGLTWLVNSAASIAVEQAHETERRRLKQAFEKVEADRLKMEIETQQLSERRKALLRERNFSRRGSTLADLQVALRNKRQVLEKESPSDTDRITRLDNQIAEVQERLVNLPRDEALWVRLSRDFYRQMDQVIDLRAKAQALRILAESAPSPLRIVTLAQVPRQPTNSQVPQILWQSLAGCCFLGALAFVPKRRAPAQLFQASVSESVVESKELVPAEVPTVPDDRVREDFERVASEWKTHLQGIEECGKKLAIGLENHRLEYEHYQEALAQLSSPSAALKTPIPLMVQREETSTSVGDAPANWLAQIDSFLGGTERQLETREGDFRIKTGVALENLAKVQMDLREIHKRMSSQPTPQNAAVLHLLALGEAELGSVDSELVKPLYASVESVAEYKRLCQGARDFVQKASQSLAVASNTRSEEDRLSAEWKQMHCETLAACQKRVEKEWVIRVNRLEKVRKLAEDYRELAESLQKQLAA